MNTALRIGLLLWVVVYLFISCQPILGGGLIAGTIGFFGGLILLVPWLVGIALFIAAIRMTNPPRR